MAKKAVLVGIHYHSFHAKHQLGSAYQDVDDVKAFLIDTLGFEEENITELKDDVDADDPQYPGEQNLKNALTQLVEGATEGDHLVFHFSGHGSQTRDQNGDEADGMDETIWPADAVPNKKMTDARGAIIDDWIKAEVVDKVPAGAKLVIFLDCCHSGTGADLPNTYTDGDELPPHSKHKVAMKKLTKEPANAEAVVVSWAACQDPHLTISFSESGGYFVKAFIKAYCADPAASHSDLLHSMKDDMLQTAQAHLESKRAELGEHFERLQDWWEDAQSEPVLGILNDEGEVLASAVAGTFGAERAVDP
ncbi:caspase family protein [Phanerochaete sordida]|uniref:Caspase family protein n=1 Tax=Phanerochaete sordida TaxID=48140 RepID=A0A9P3L996_9APHY|nr:caspase family protein [Phanerochaete sordida]